MKRFLSILAVNFLVFSAAFPTPQFPDKLIIGNDTVYSEFSLLENLQRDKKLSAPFDYNGMSFPHTACWRGYTATWEVIDDNLLLKEVRRCDNSTEKLNIIEYLENNGYNPTIINGFVFADWYSDSLIRANTYLDSHNTYQQDEFFIGKNYFRRNDEKIELIFENGKLIENNITPIKDYKIGDTLYVNTSYFQDWYIWFKHKPVQLKGVINGKSRKMVRLEIISYGTDNNRRIRKIQREIIKDLDNFWVNPRYCTTVE